MKNTFLYTFFLLGLILLSSCQKEEAFELVVLSEEEKAERYLANYPVDVLFANIKMDHQNKTLTGYMIDKRGKLKYLPETALQVLGISFLDNGEIPSIPIRILYFRAEEQKSLSPLDIKEYLLKAYRLDDTPVINAVNDNAAISYYKFNYKADQNHHSASNYSCNSGSSISPEIAQIMIQAKGQFSVHMNQTQKEISDWLDSFETTYSFLN